MRYAICNETFGDWPLDKALTFARQAGYTGWEVAPFMLGSSAYEIPSSQRIEYRRAVEKAGLEIIGLHWLLAKTQGYHVTTADAAVRQKNSGLPRRACEVVCRSRWLVDGVWFATATQCS